MSTSFNDRARAAAERSPGVAGLSRRQLIQRGALVVGTAWTAPMLLSATPAWAGASICTDPRYPSYSLCPDKTTFKCCPDGQACVPTYNTLGVITGQGCDIPLGGACGNAGNGQCNGGASRCNSQPKGSNFCGGPGAYCDYNNNAICIPTSPCSPGYGIPGSRCGGIGATCTSTSNCAPATSGGGPALTCRNASGTQTSTGGTCQL